MTKKKDKLRIFAVTFVIINVISIMMTCFHFSFTQAFANTPNPTQQPQESFEDMYAYVLDDVSNDSYQKLQYIYEAFSIEVRFDMEEYDRGQYSRKTENLPLSQYDFAIDQTYRFLNLLGTDDISKEIMKNSLFKVHNVAFTYYRQNSRVQGLNDINGGNIMIAYEVNGYDPDKLLATYLEEASDNIFNRNRLSLIKFRTHNKFRRYREELIDGEESLQPQISGFVSESYEDYKQNLYKNGLLDSLSYEEKYDDMNAYFKGLFLNHDNFWEKYDEYEIIQDKTHAIIDELSSINESWTLEYFKNLSYPK